MRVDLVVLGLAAVDGLHVEGVAEDEGEAFARAQVGDPVPGEDALDGDHHVVVVRGDHVEQVLQGGRAMAMDADLALRVEDADVHPSRMQIDPTVVSVLFGIEPHPAPPSHPRCGVLCLAAITLPHGWQGGAWMRINRLERTGSAGRSAWAFGALSATVKEE